MVSLFHWPNSMTLLLVFVRIFTVFCFILPLAACEKNMSYEALITHPAELKARVTACEAHPSTLPDESARCEVVMKAATDFEARVEIASGDPEKFGADLLAKQEACATRKDEKACQSAKVDLAVLSLSTPT